MLVNRFGVLWKPLRCRLDRAPLVIGVCMKLHNLIIDRTGGRGYSGARRVGPPEVWDYDAVRIGKEDVHYKTHFSQYVLGKNGEPVHLMPIASHQEHGDVTDTLLRDQKRDHLRDAAMIRPPATSECN